MKNKKLAYILLPVVIFVWGAIAYNIISYYFDDKSTENMLSTNAIKKNPDAKLDTFSLLLNYPDPFLKAEAAYYEPVIASTESPVKPSIPNRNTAPKRNINNIKSTPISWPAITYCGIIKNKKSNKTCSIIKINGKEYIMSIGDTRSDVTLLKLYSDSAVVTFQQHNKTFNK